MLRWVLWNILGWTLGLYLTFWLTSLIGFVSLFIGSIFQAVLLGFIQRYLLQDQIILEKAGWLFYSGLGGAIAFLPVLLATLAFIAHPFIGAILMGGLYGLIFSYFQQLYLRQQDLARGSYWVLANTVGGMLCAPLTLGMLSKQVPVLFSPGILIFGLITGYCIQRLVRDIDIQKQGEL